MRQLVRRGGRLGIAVIAAGCFIAGVVLIWRLATPETIPNLGTAHLLGMLGLFVLPAATIACWELDRRAARRPRTHTHRGVPTAGAPNNSRAESPAGESAAIPPARRRHHHKRPRGRDASRRTDAVTGD